MRVAITGGAGRIGRRMVARLRDAHEIRVLDADPPGQGGDDTEFVAVDITEFKGLTAALAGVDAVVHLAAIPWDLPDDAPRVAEVNIQGTQHVLEAAARARVSKAIVASSICAVGFMFRRTPFVPQYLPVNEAHPAAPENVYGLSKLIAEFQGQMYQRRYGMDVICFRIAPVWFGDGELNPFTLWSLAGVFRTDVNRDAIWAYVGAEDVAQATALALDPSCDGFRVYNIGAAETCAESGTLELIRAHYPTVTRVKPPANGTSGPHWPLWSIEKAVSELGYRPEFTWRELVGKLPERVLEIARTGSLDDLREAVYGTRGTRPMG